MPARQLLILSALLIVVLAFVAFKITQKPSSVSAEFDLVTGRSTLRDTPEIYVVERAGSQLLLQLDLSFYKHAHFKIKFGDLPLEGTCLNIGDSSGNDGWGGDGGKFSNNAELQVIGPSGGFLLYGSDALLEAQNNETKSLLLKGEPALVAPKDLLALEIFDGTTAWSNGRDKTDMLKSPYLFALNGQPDAKHGGANDSLVFAAFNRAIAAPQNKGRCVNGVQITLTRQ